MVRLGNRTKRTYSLEVKTVEIIERIARESRRDLSSVIDIAIEEYCKAHYPQLYNNGKEQA